MVALECFDPALEAPAARVRQRLRAAERPWSLSLLPRSWGVDSLFSASAYSRHATPLPLCRM
jgi:hypothetical protein